MLLVYCMTLRQEHLLTIVLYHLLGVGLNLLFLPQNFTPPPNAQTNKFGSRPLFENTQRFH